MNAFKKTATKPSEVLEYSTGMGMNEYLGQTGFLVRTATPRSTDALVAATTARVLRPVVRYVSELGPVAFKDGSWIEYADALAYGARKLLQADLTEDGAEVPPKVRPYATIEYKQEELASLAQPFMRPTLQGFTPVTITEDGTFWDNELQEKFVPVEEDTRYQSQSKLSSIVKLLPLQDALITPAASLDQHPEIVAAPSWTFNLDTFEFGEPDPELLLTKCLPGDPAKPSASDLRESRFARFLEEVLPEEERRYVQKYLGASFYGDARLQRILVFVGEGSNGKSILIEALLAALGPYAGVVPPSIFQSNRDEHPTEKMIFRGLRFAFGQETQRGQKWRTAVLKNLSGSDEISARYMGKDYVTFTPSHSLILATNHRPIIDINEPSFWRRYDQIDFSTTFRPAGEPLKPGEKVQDPNLLSELRTPREQAAILAWLFEGARLYNTEGLERTERMKAAAAEARRDSNLAVQFMHEMFRVDQASGKEIPASTLFKFWEEYRATNSSLKNLAPTSVKGIRELAAEFNAEYVPNQNGANPARVLDLTLTETGLQAVFNASEYTGWARDLTKLFSAEIAAFKSQDLASI